MSSYSLQKRFHNIYVATVAGVDWTSYIWRLAANKFVSGPITWRANTPRLFCVEGSDFRNLEFLFFRSAVDWNEGLR